MKRTRKFCFNITIAASTCFKLFLFSILIFNFSSCKNNVNVIIEDYNSNFSIEYISNDAPGPGDEDFVASNMLMDRYFVSITETLNLTAPKNCKYYQWELADYDKKITDINFATLTAGTSYTTQRFVMYMPTSGIGEGYYRLRLIVTDEEDVKYTDNCILVVYKETNLEE